MPLKPSDQAPAFCAQLSGGKTVSLADYRGQRLVLIFVRHLACLPCQEHLMEVQDSLPTISEQGAQVLVVSFDTVEQLEGYRARLKLTFPVAADPERVAYEAYGLTQGSLLHIWHPKTLWRYVVLRLSCHAKSISWKCRTAYQPLVSKAPKCWLFRLIQSSNWRGIARA